MSVEQNPEPGTNSTLSRVARPRMHWSLWAIVHAFLIALFVTAAGCGGGDSGTTDNDTGVVDETGGGDTGRDSNVADSRGGDTADSNTTDTADTAVLPDTRPDAVDSGDAADTRTDADAGDVADSRSDADSGDTGLGDTRAADADAADTAVTLVSIAVSPPSPTIPNGTTQPFKATGTYSDGSVADITTTVSWQSSNPAVADIAATGIATAASPGGPITISATLSGKTGTAALTVTAAILRSIDVTPTRPSNPAGTTRQFTATGTYSDTTTKDITNTVTWSSDNLTVATVSDVTGSKGLAQALTPGTANIIATDPTTTVSGSTQLTVTAATLSRIDVTPLTANAPKGTKQAFKATGVYSDGSSKDLTTSVTWSSSNPAFATISNTAPDQGLASAIAVGTVTITATDSSGATGTATLNVTDAVVTSIEVTPANPIISRLSTQQFRATATFSDGTKGDVTASVSWTSEKPVVADISNAPGSKGRATGLTGGTSIITATDVATGVSGTTLLTVTSAAVTSIVITPAPTTTAPKGTTKQFTAQANYDDGTFKDVTDSVTWTSSDTAVASISNAAGSQGLASALTEGPTNITATDPGSGKVSNTSLLTVTSAVLVSIEVSPADPSIPAGETQQFKATGTYTDGTTADITDSVVFTSSAPAIADVSNAPGSKGLATSPKFGSPGKTTISAAASGVTGSTTLTVTAAVLLSINVTPATASVANGTSQDFVATGTFSDGTTKDLTTSVTWSSESPAVATVSNAPGTEGRATGVTVGGPVKIIATKGSISGSAALTVTAAVLTGITVTPADTSIPKGTTQQFTATGAFSDGTTKDLTTSVNWTTGDPAVATISNTTGTNGLAFGAGIGTTSVTASLGGKSGSTNLTVNAAVLRSIAVTPPTATAPKGTTQRYKATGTYSDGSLVDITSQVSWTSSDPTVASISNATGSKGLATALNPGPTGSANTTITATDTGPGSTGFSGTATLTVTSATILTITVTPSTATIAQGATQQYTAMGHYTDGSNRDVTASVTWSTVDPTVAAISNAAGSQGLATGLKFGTTTVTATDPATKVAGTAKIIVT